MQSKSIYKTHYLTKIKGNNELAIQYIRDTFTADELFTIITGDKYYSLPGSIKAAFCQLLHLFLGVHIPTESEIGIKYTWSWGEISPDFVPTASTRGAHKSDDSDVCSIFRLC